MLGGMAKSGELEECRRFWIEERQSVPGFLAQVTTEMFEKTTVSADRDLEPEARGRELGSEGARLRRLSSCHELRAESCERAKMWMRVRSFWRLV